MATPVGPAPRDPNDPDLWDWTGESDDDYEPTARRHPAKSALALMLVVVLVLLVLANVL